MNSDRAITLQIFSDPEDIFGSVLVKEGRIVEGSYQRWAIYSQRKCDHDV
jgi:hypothetical protein